VGTTPWIGLSCRHRAQQDGRARSRPQEDPVIHVTIYGAGAIGGFTGASLARAGHDVVLVDSAEAHVAAMNARGLTIETPDGEWSVAVRAVTPRELTGPCDLVLLAVKSQHTAGALDALVPCLAPQGTVVSLQNGLNEERIAERIGAARTVGCLVNWGADWMGPGRIQWGGPGALVLGELDGAESTRVRDLARLLAPVGDVKITDNLWGVKWSKHVYGALLFATALVDTHVYEVVERSRPIQRMLVALVAEGMAVAEAAGVRLEAFDEFDPRLYRAAVRGDDRALDELVESASHHYRTRTKTKTGVWRDLAVRKRKTEVDGLFDVTLAKADRLGVPVPLTRLLIALIHDLEDGRRTMGWDNLEILAGSEAGSTSGATAPPHWSYRDPLEPAVLGAVAPDILMEHTRAIAAHERESGSKGEALAFDYIAATLERYGLTVERREIEAFISLPQEGRLVLPGGEAIEGLAHAFSTSVDALDCELVDAGEGTADDYARAGARGKIALVNGLATPGKAWTGQEAGVAAQVFVNVDHLHNMIVTTVWGTPAPETASRIPRTPCLSIRRADAERLRRLMQAGPLRLRMTTRVRTGWMPIPHLVGHLDGRMEDRFVLLSGHVDSWHHGAMDNASANATMLEVARLLATHRDRLRRGLRVAFWSGHSHGRYAGSAWYADHAWADLHRRCLLHLNCDSTGARGATDYARLHVTEDAQPFAETVVHDVTGQPARGHRFSRAGDQSFWGAGVPSAFMSLSGVPKQDTELSRAMERILGSSGFPWWWHTREDTIDKIDPGVLALDTKVYLAATLRAVNAPLVPLDHARAARSLLAVAEELQSVAGRRFDLGPALAAVRRLAERADALARALAGLAGSAQGAATLDRANRALVRLSRVLVPLAYTTGDPFRHDLALPLPPLAGLQGVRELARLDPGSDDFKFAAAALVREQNRAVHALEEAGELIDEFLAARETLA
jgi:2-dehydropantoate 2-reductase